MRSYDVMPACSRRDVLKSASVLVGGLVAGTPLAASESPASKPPAADASGRPRMCLFSKALQNRPFTELPPMLTEFGVDAVDLTCRPGGHVLPERVTDDLPQAFAMFKAASIAVPMITTAITDAHEPHAEATIRTAAALGIRHAKIGYYRYRDLSRIHETMADVKGKIRDIAALCSQYGVTAGFHNHSGVYVGAPMWDLGQLLEGLDPRAIGSYFDLGHATAEGGLGGWQIGLNLLLDRISIVGIKDMAYMRDENGRWRPVWGPLGEGMVRFDEAFTILKEAHFAGPIALHVEYGAYTAPVGSDEDRRNIAFIRRDVATLKKLLQDCGLA